MIRPRRVLAAVLAAASLTLSACNLDPRTATLPGGVATGDDGYSVTAVFAGADNLVPNSEVQYQNVRIGTVRSIDLDHTTWHALVRISLLKSVPSAGERRGLHRAEEPARCGVRADRDADRRPRQARLRTR